MELLIKVITEKGEKRYVRNTEEDHILGFTESREDAKIFNTRGKAYYVKKNCEKVYGGCKTVIIKK